MNGWPRVAWLSAVVGGLIALAGSPVEAGKWSRAYINSLPDEAFASVEVRADGTRVRHLPHHDAQGRVDVAHLRNAMSRLHQVRWIDPAKAEAARRHLLEHYRQLGLRVPGEGRAQREFIPHPRLWQPPSRPVIVAGARAPRTPAAAAPHGPGRVAGAGTRGRRQPMVTEIPKDLSSNNEPAPRSHPPVSPAGGTPRPSGRARGPLDPVEWGEDGST